MSRYVASMIEAVTAQTRFDVTIPPGSETMCTVGTESLSITAGNDIERADLTIESVHELGPRPVD